MNARDLGGITTVDGKTIVPNKLIRSARPYKLPKKTEKKLREIGVTTVVDLRTDAEVYGQPPCEIEGATRLWLPTVTTASDHIDDLKTSRLTLMRESKRLKHEFHSAKEYMIETYRSIVFSKQPQECLRSFLRLAIENDGCLMWHCASGKDRTGICSMLLESLLGVPEEIIYNDYLASKRGLFRKTFARRLGIIIAPMSFKFKSILLGFSGLKKIYLKTIIEDMKARFGSVIGYCKQILGITDDDITVLRAKYLV